MRRPPGRAALLAGLLLMACMWVLRPGGLPLYEGIAPPTEPYRYLHPTATSGQRLPPASVDATIPVAGGTSPQILLQTGESTPQAALSIPAGALVLPAGTTTLRVVIRAVDPPAVPPAGGALDGNVYLMEVTANGARVPLAPTQQAYITLEGTGASGIPHLEVFAADMAWHTLITSPSGTNNLWFGPGDALGDAALVLSPHTGTPEELSTAAISAIVLGSVLAVIAALFLAVRTARRSGAG